MKNEVETESVVHDNTSLCGKVFYPCQSTAKFKKKEKKRKTIVSGKWEKEK